MKKITNKEWIEKAKKVHGDRYDYSETKYDGNRKNVLIICKTHGEFLQSPKHHLNGCGCPLCFNENKRGGRLKEKDFIDKCSAIYGDKYDLSKIKYVNFKTKIEVVCKEHVSFYITPANFLSFHGCPKCSKKHRYTTDEFIEQCKKVHGDRYDYSKVNYINNHTKVCIICPKHGEFWQDPHHHVKGVGCPICCESKLEKEISSFLKDNGIIFERQKIFNWLKINSNLKLDFYLPEYNVAIECQGRQHFEPFSFRKESDESKLLENFQKVLQYDIKKYSLCKEHGIKIFYYSDIKNTENNNLHIIYNNKINLLNDIRLQQPQ